MSIYFDLNPITQGIIIDSKPQNSPPQQAYKKKHLNEQNETGQSQLTASAKQIILIRNENQQMREQLAQKKEQLAWMSYKAIAIGKQYMNLMKQRDDKQIMIEKLATKLQKYKKKNQNLQESLKVFKVENESILQMDTFNKETAKSNYEKACRNLDKILQQSTQGNTKNIQSLIKQTKELIKP